MKVKRLVLTNVLSYLKRTEFTFENGINIVIGPNGGGKTNLQKVLALVLSKYFIHQYDFQANDQGAKILRFDPWTLRVLERNLQRFNDDASDQIIEIELAPERLDIQNIKTIGENLEKFNEELSYWESPFESYAPAALITEISQSKSLIYRIKNLELMPPAEHSAEWGFAEYLRTLFIFMRLTGRDASTKLCSPVFFFFSERNAGKSLDIGAGNLSEQQYYQGFRSAYQAAVGESTNLMQWGAQHFARLHRKAMTRAAERRDATTADFFNAEPDVRLITRYMERLGYDYTFHMDEDSSAYTFALRKSGRWITANKFSSGEREIVHFLLAMFALNAKDGLVLVDEPELHLHPRWQRIFLHLFQDIAQERNNQFVIATHSPVFVSPDTINSIIRVYQPDDNGSTKISLRDVVLPEKKNLVRMINSQNNEQIFFADKVVLVEGITDRIVFTSLIEGACAKFSNHQAIEIIEVGGKNNFESYRSLLTALSTRAIVIADRDYLVTIGEPATKSLFQTSDDKADDSLLKDKKSQDRVALMSSLRVAIETESIDELRQLAEYVASRHLTFKVNLEPEEQRQLDRDLTRLRASGYLVLAQGEVEDYLPPGVSSLREIVEMTIDPNWVNRIPSAAKRLELARFLAAVLDLQLAEAARLEHQMENGTVNFPATAI